MNSKKIFFSIAVVMLLLFGYVNLKESSSHLSSSAIAWTTIEDAVEIARSNDKAMLVYVYTTWCSWCKKMDREVFTDSRIDNLIDTHFVAVSLNAESDRQVHFRDRAMSERELSSLIGAQGYPTTVFLEPNGDVILAAPGYHPPERFKTILTYVGEGHYAHTDWESYRNSEM